MVTTTLTVLGLVLQQVPHASLVTATLTELKATLVIAMLKVLRTALQKFRHASFKVLWTILWQVRHALLLIATLTILRSVLQLFRHATLVTTTVTTQRIVYRDSFVTPNLLQQHSQYKGQH